MHFLLVTTDKRQTPRSWANFASHPGPSVGRMTGTAHLNWLADVFAASKWERDVATSLAAYSASPTVSTARDLAWALNNLSGMLYGWRIKPRSLAAMQSAVAVLRHEVDALPAGSDAAPEPTNDLVYLLDSLADTRLDAGLPEAAIRALDEGIARLSLAMRGQHPPYPSDMDLLGRMLETRAEARYQVIMGRTDAPLPAKAS